MSSWLSKRNHNGCDTSNVTDADGVLEDTNTNISKSISQKLDTSKVVVDKIDNHHPQNVAVKGWKLRDNTIRKSMVRRHGNACSMVAHSFLFFLIALHCNASFDPLIHYVVRCVEYVMLSTLLSSLSFSHCTSLYSTLPQHHTYTYPDLGTKTSQTCTKCDGCPSISSYSCCCS